MTKSKEEVNHDKPCTLCGIPRQVLVRCRIDETGKWHFVCPGKCWHSVSGGVEDAKGLKDEYPHYRYGGMWKNKHADGPVSARKPKRVKERQKRRVIDRGRNDGGADTAALEQAGQGSSDGEEEESEPGVMVDS